MAIGALVEKYATTIRLSSRTLQEIMSCAIADTKETFSSAGVPINHLHLHRLSRTGPFADDPNADPSSRVLQSGAAEGSLHPDARPSLTSDDGLLDQLVEEIKVAADSDAGANLSQVVMMVLEACCRGAHFDRVIFGLTTPDRSMIRGRLGLGPGVEGMIDLFRVALSDPADPYANALANQRDIFVDNSRPNAFQQSRPLQSLGVKCLALYPVVVDHVVVGCLYLDRIHAAKPPSTRTLQTVGRLRDTLANVIARTRAGAK